MFNQNGERYIKYQNIISAIVVLQCKLNHQLDRILLLNIW